MNMSSRAAALAAIMACGFSPAIADEAPGCERPQLKEAEGTADGGITAEKHASTASKRFETMDKDKNGKITAAEIGSSHGAESIVWANHPESPAEKIRPSGRRSGLTGPPTIPVSWGSDHVSPPSSLQPARAGSVASAIRSWTQAMVNNRPSGSRAIRWS